MKRFKKQIQPHLRYCMHQLSRRKQFETGYRDQELLHGVLYQEAVEELIIPLTKYTLVDLSMAAEKLRQKVHSDNRVKRVPLDLLVPDSFPIQYRYLESMASLLQVKDNVLFEYAIGLYLDLPQNYMGKDLKHRELAPHNF